MITEEMKEGKSPEEIVQMLKENCVRTEEQEVKRFFSEEEMQDMRVDLTEKSIERHDKEELLKAESKAAKDEISALTKKVKENLKNLKRKYVVQDEIVYLLADQEDNTMYTYNSTGDIIHSRRLLPSEKQTRIMNINKAS